MIVLNILLKSQNSRASDICCLPTPYVIALKYCYNTKPHEEQNQHSHTNLIETCTKYINMDNRHKLHKKNKGKTKLQCIYRNTN